MKEVGSAELQPGNAEAKPLKAKFNFWRWFWLSTIPVSIFWLWYDFYAPPNHIHWEKSSASAQKLAAKSGKPMILFFTGEWCSPCRIMKRTVWADKQVEAAVNARFTPVMIDVDDPNEKATLKRYSIGATPTTIISDPQGKELTRVLGGIGKREFLAWIDGTDRVATPSP